MKYTLLLLITPTCFGCSYVFCNIANQYLPPFAMNFFRYFIAAIVMLPFSIFGKKSNLKDSIKGGFLLSLTIFPTGYIQQLCVDKMSAGKMGFLAALYVIMVPFANKIIYKKNFSLRVLLSVLLGVIGLAILCNIDNFAIGKAELLMILVAFIYVFNILWMDKYCKKADIFDLLLATFIFTLIFNLIFTVSNETITISNIKGALPALLFLGVMSSCASYVAQAHAQRHVDPILASVIMSLESIVSIVAGALILHQSMTVKELIGCLILFISLLLTQYFTYKDSLKKEFL